MEDLAADFIIQNNPPIEFDAEISESEHFDCSFEINVVPDISHLATKQELEDVNTALSDSIIAEATTRDNADTALSDSIVAVSDNLQIEATTRADNDTILQNNINTVSNNLTVEIGNRAAADTILQGNINSLDDKVDSINGALTDSIDAVDNKYDSITGGLDDKIDSVEGALIDSITAVDGKYDTITSNLSDSITTLSDTLEAYNTALNGRIDTLAGAVSDLDSVVSSNYTTLNDKIDSIDGALSDSINALDSIVSDNFTTLSDSITALDSVVSSNFTTLSDSIVALDSVVSSNYTTLDNKIDSVSGALADSINALDSVVSSNYTTLDDKIDSISGALSDSISAIDSIISGYGDIVNYNAADFATSIQGALADTALQPNDNISELNNDAGYITSSSLPTVNNATITIQKNGTTVESFTLNQSTNETVNISVPTTAAEVDALPDTTTINDLTTSTQQAALNSGANTTNIGQIATNTTAISNEVTDRQNADIALQNQIDAIVSSSDVFDIVGTYAELQAYDISTVPVNDIIKVLVDSTHNDAATYYRCVETGGVKSWSYIGSEGAYYTKGEADSTFVPQTRTINNKALSSNITLDASDVGALPDSTVIPAAQVNSDWNAVSGVAEILNKPTIPTDTSDLTNGAGFITSAALSNYVDLSSDQNITGVKTFVGQKRIGFKQSSSSDKLGFTLFNNGGTEKGYLEYNPSNTVDSVPLMTLGNYASASGGLTHVGFRKYSSISGASGAYNLLAPLISDARTPFNLTTTYTNFYLPLGFTDGNTTVLTAKSGVVDLSSLLPTVPTNISAFTNDSGYITSSALNGYATETWVTNKGYAVASSLATVATSGSYNDLTNKPTIPAAQIQSDWNQTNTNAVDYIKNKPTIPSGVIVDQVYDGTSANAQSGVAIEGELSTNYQSKLVSGTNIKTVNNTSILGNGNISVGTVTSVNNVAPISGNVSLTIPTVNNSTITIQKNSATVDTFTLNQSTAKTINITVPTDTGDLTNGAGYITSSALSGYAKTADLATVATSGSYNDLSNKPTIPTVNNATLTIQKNGTTVKTFTANASTDVTCNITVPTKTSELTNDSSFITGITSSMVTTALGYTPYSSANPSGYQANVIETIKVNGTALTPTSKTVDITVPSAVTESTVSGWGFTKNTGTVTSVNNVAPVNGNVTLSIPTVNNATLTIQKNGTTVKTFTANASSNVTANITVPTKTSDLTNDSGFITGITSSDVTTALGYTPVNKAGDTMTGTLKVGTTAQIETNGYITGTWFKTTAATENANLTSVAMIDSSGWIYKQSKNTLLNGVVKSVNSTQPDANGNVSLTIPSVGNGTITIQQGGTTVDTFTTNQSSAKTINIPKEIFVATYGTTTYQEVLDAYNAGKTVFVQYNYNAYESIYAVLNYAFITADNTILYFSFNCVTGNTNTWKFKLHTTEGWSVTQTSIANEDLSNLSATGEAKFDAKVNKSGDTMTGELSIQADSAKIKLSNNYLTKGTNPDNTIFYSYQFNDSTNSDTWQNTRLGLLEESVQSNGTTSIALITYRNQAASTEGAALRLSMTSAGVASCTFPNTTCVDSHWVKASKQFFGGRTLSDSSSYLGLDLSDYLPNDSYSYELLLKGYVTTTNTSGAYIYLDIYSTLSDSQRVAEAQTRASATVEGGGSTLIPVSSDRILRVNRNTSFKGSATLYAVAYKRLGTNS